MVARIAVATLLIVTGWSGTVAAQVAAEFYLEKSNYAIGEPIFVYFRAVNEGPEPQRLYSADPNSDCSAFHIRVSNDRPLASCARAVNCLSSSIVLQPKEEHVERMLLNLGHDVSVPGNYSVEAEVAGSFAYGTPITVKPGMLRFQVDPRAPEPEVFQPLLDQLRSGYLLKRIEAARALAGVAPRSLEGTLLSFADDPDLRQFAPLALHRLNTPASTKALADLLSKTTPGSFEHWQAAAYLADDACADAPWRNSDKTHIQRK
jgi:hypothetical protein